MIELSPNLFVGKVTEVKEAKNNGFNIINLSGSYHRYLLGWGPKEKKTNDPHYVIREWDKMLSFNFIDGPAYFYDYQGKGVERFIFMLDWLDIRLRSQQNTIIVCDQAISRSPTVAMLYMSKRLYSPTTFEEACDGFKRMYTNWQPKGILEFLKQNWKEIK